MIMTMPRRTGVLVSIPPPPPPAAAFLSAPAPSFFSACSLGGCAWASGFFSAFSAMFTPRPNPMSGPITAGASAARHSLYRQGGRAPCGGYGMETSEAAGKAASPSFGYPIAPRSAGFHGGGDELLAGLPDR